MADQQSESSHDSIEPSEKWQTSTCRMQSFYRLNRHHRSRQTEEADMPDIEDLVFSAGLTRKQDLRSQW